MKKILISIGPIHGKLDSVKIITNKFKGGLAALTAKQLALKRPQDKITVVKCNETSFYKPEELKVKNIKIVNVEDFFEYEKFILSNKFDVYILAAAVANLIPKDPLKGKFPSHNYKEEEEINIPFVITRRVILHIKEKFPRSTLIGYKLFDGSYEELIKAGWDLLVETKANAIFCNDPKTAKDKKICLLPDGSRIELNFEDHVNFIDRIIDLSWYKTKIVSFKKPLFDKTDSFVSILDKTAEKFPPYIFGCVAYKSGDGFYTTARGKKDVKKDFAYVHKVNHNKKVVFADKKASLNAPLLDLIFTLTNSKVIVHAHKKLDAENLDYIFSGTNEEDNLKSKILQLHKEGKNFFNIKFHGYYSWFDSFEEAENFTEGKISKIKNIEWNQYNDLFPDRYLKESSFDINVKKEIDVLSKKLNRKINVLEIGSNKKVRFFNRKYINKYYAFDKFVKVEEEGIIQIKERELLNISVDMIILRSSFNYLDKKEIANLKKVVLKNKGVLMFNTFKKPSTIKRFYTSRDLNGIEESEYDKRNNLIIHSLYPKGQNYVIRHSFFYYDINTIKKLFVGLKFEKTEEGNTIHIKISG